MNSIKVEESKPLINVGVVGCGYWGPNLIRNLRSLPNCRMRAMADMQPARLGHMKSLYPEVQAFTDFDDMLNTGGIDAAVVATPVKHHHKLAKASLEAGKHTFIEKPMAATSGECEELIEIADRNGLILMVGHTFIYSSAIQKISEIISTGDVGEIRYINSRRLNLGLFQPDINVAWDLAPHDISIILNILKDTPIQINCQGNAHVTPGVEDVTNMSLTFPDNRFATIVYDDLEPIEKIRIYDVRVDRPRHYDTFGEFHYSYHYGDSYIPHIDQAEPLKSECQHFLNCIAEGTQPMTCGRKGLQLVRILEASSESIRRSGAPVDLIASDPIETPSDGIAHITGEVPTHVK